VDFDYIKLIGELGDEERLRFYEYLAHNLTVSARAIWVDEGLTDGEKLENLKYLNEIMHRVTMKSAKLRTHKNTFSETDSWEDINDWVSRSPGLGPHVEWALKFSYELLC
jgi:hypothetical protein